MAKIIIPNKNTSWGVKVNPNSPNVYEHIISWESESIKEAWVEKEFLSESFNTLIPKLKEHPFVRVDALKGQFKIDIDDYNKATGSKWTLDEVLNKDFFIIIENNKKYYYVVNEITRTGTPNNNVIKADVELDIFFNYNIKDMFNDKPINIQRAMVNRWKDDTVNKVIVDNVPVRHKDKKNTKFVPELTAFYSDEEIAQDVDKDKVVKDEILLSQSYKNIKIFDKKSSTEITDNTKKQVVYEYLNRFEQGSTFNHISLIPKGDAGLIDKEWAKYDSRPYVTIWWIEPILDKINNNVNTPLFNGNIQIKTDPTDDKVIFDSSYYINMDDQLDKIATSQHADLLPMSRGVSYVNPYSRYYDKYLVEYDNKGDILKVTIILKKELLKDANDRIKTWNSELNLSANNKVKIVDLSMDINFNDYHYDHYNNIYGLHGYGFDKNWNKRATPTINVDKYIKDEQYNTEIKTLLYPYTSGYIKGNNNIDLTMLNDKPRIYTDGSPGISAHYINLYKDEFVNGTSMQGYLVDNNDYTLPDSVNAWSDYMSQHKATYEASIKNQRNNAIASVITGAVGIGVGVATGGSGIALGGSVISNSINTFTSNINQINNRKAMKSDLMNKSNTVENVQGHYFLDQQVKHFKPYLVTKGLTPQAEYFYNEFFYKWGYNFGGLNYNINKLLNNRYWFNYIRAIDTFENIKLNLSAAVKQQIDNTLSNGVTIWHLRNIKGKAGVFKGVKAYGYENAETSLESVKGMVPVVTKPVSVTYIPPYDIHINPLDVFYNLIIDPDGSAPSSQGIEMRKGTGKPITIFSGAAQANLEIKAMSYNIDSIYALYTDDKDIPFFGSGYVLGKFNWNTHKFKGISKENFTNYKFYQKNNRLFLYYNGLGGFNNKSNIYEIKGENVFKIIDAPDGSIISSMSLMPDGKIVYLTREQKGVLGTGTGSYDKEINRIFIVDGKDVKSKNVPIPWSYTTNPLGMKQINADQESLYRLKLFTMNDKILILMDTKGDTIWENIKNFVMGSNYAHYKLFEYHLDSNTLTETKTSIRFDPDVRGLVDWQTGTRYGVNIIVNENRHCINNYRLSDYDESDSNTKPEDYYNITKETLDYNLTRIEDVKIDLIKLLNIKNPVRNFKPAYSLELTPAFLFKGNTLMYINVNRDNSLSVELESLYLVDLDNKKVLWKGEWTGHNRFISPTFGKDVVQGIYNN